MKALRLRCNVLKDKNPDAAFLARVAWLKKELLKPQLTKSVREQATKRHIASWTQAK